MAEPPADPPVLRSHNADFEVKIIILTSNNLGRLSGRPQTFVGLKSRLEAKTIRPNNLGVVSSGPHDFMGSSSLI